MIWSRLSHDGYKDQGGYDKIMCGAFLLSQQLFSPLTLYGNLNLPFLSVYIQSGGSWC